MIENPHVYRAVGGKRRFYIVDIEGKQHQETQQEWKEGPGYWNTRSVHQKGLLASLLVASQELLVEVHAIDLVHV